MQSVRRSGVVASALRLASRHKKHFIPEHDDPLRDMLDEDTDHQTAAAMRLEKLDKILTEKTANGLVTIDPAEKVNLVKEKRIDGLMHRVEERIERTHHYYSCMALTVFISFFVLVMALQNDVGMAFSIEKTMLDTVVGDLDTETFALKSTDEFFTWFGDNIVDRIFRDPICGDGVCEQPHEFPSVGRFGCEIDCGKYLKQTTISIKLETFPGWSQAAQGQWDISRIRRRVNPDYRWNIYSETIGAFLFEEDQLPDATIVTDVPDGALTLHMYQTEIVSTQVDDKSIYDYLFMTKNTLPQREASTDFDFGDKREAIAAGAILMRQIFDYCFGGGMSLDDLDNFDMNCFNPEQDTQIRIMGSYGLKGTITTANGTRDKTILTEVDFCDLLPNGVVGLIDPANKAYIQTAAVDCDTVRRSDTSSVGISGEEEEEPSAEALAPLAPLAHAAAAGWLASQELTAEERERVVGAVQAALGPAAQDSPAARALKQFLVPIFGPCLSHAECDQSQPDRFMGFPGQFCDAAGTCNICSNCQLDGVHAINGICPQSFCPGSGNYPACINAEELARNWTCPATKAFGVWNYHPPGARVDVKEEPAPVPRFVTPYNRLVGPVMLTQIRRGNGQCDQVINEEVQKFSRLDKCIGTRRDGTPYGLDPAFLPTSAEYDGKLAPEAFYVAGERVQVNFTRQTADGERVTTQEATNPIGFFPHQYDSLTHADKESGLIWERDRDAFKQYFDERVTATRARSMLNYLNDGRWIDDETTNVEVELVTFNANLNRFTYVQFKFEWQAGGSIHWDYKLQAIAMDIYDVDWGTAQLLAELLCIIMLCANLLTEIRDIIISLRIFQLRQYVMSPGNFFDWAHFILMTASWIAWLNHWHKTSSFSMKASYPVLTDISSSARYFTADPQLELEYLELMDEVRKSAGMMEEYSALSSICIVLFVLRMLKALDFQPRMGVVTQTIAHSLVDVVHFLFLWCLVFVGYACVGTLLFGHQFRSMSDLQKSFTTLANMILTMDRNEFYSQMAHSAPGWSFHLYLWSFIILSFFLLINIFLAILVDSYATLKSKTDVSSTVYDELMELAWDWFRWLTYPKTRFMSDERLMERLEQHKSGLPSTYQLRQAVVTSLDHKEQVLLPGGVEVGLHAMRRLCTDPADKAPDAPLPSPDQDDVSSDEEDDKDIEWASEREQDRVEDLVERYSEKVEHEEEELLGLIRVDGMKRALSLFRHQQWLLGKVSRLEILLARLAARLTTNKPLLPRMTSTKLLAKASKTVAKAHGLLRVTVVEARGLPLLDLMRSVDPYCLVFLADAHGEPGEVAYKTDVKKGNAPKWHEEFLFGISPRTISLCITLFDKDAVTEDDLIGSVQVTIGDLEPWADLDEWHTIVNTKIPAHKMHGAQLRLHVTRQPAEGDGPRPPAPNPAPAPRAPPAEALPSTAPPPANGFPHPAGPPGAQGGGNADSGAGVGGSGPGGSGPGEEQLLSVGSDMLALEEAPQSNTRNALGELSADAVSVQDGGMPAPPGEEGARRGRSGTPPRALNDSADPSLFSPNPQQPLSPGADVHPLSPGA